MNLPVSRASAPHYHRASVCDGWRLVTAPELSVIEERVPPGAAEKQHYHRRARQFFYVLSGEATLEIEGVEHKLAAGSGLEVPPGVRHKFANRAAAEVFFLVISSPATQDDRVDVE